MNRLIAARPILRAAVQSNVAAVQQRFSSHGYKSDYEIGPPASFNQLPQPEGDWTANNQKKQSKYNAILAASAAVFAGTIVYFTQSGKVFFNASAPETYE